MNSLCRSVATLLLTFTYVPAFLAWTYLARMGRDMRRREPRVRVEGA